MAEETEPTAETATAVVDAPETQPEPETVAPDGPTPEQLQAERDARLRAEAQAQAYRDAAVNRQPEKPADQPARIFTPAEIEEARLTGKYSAQQLGYEYERYTRHVAEQAAEKAREQERAANRDRDLGARISAHLNARPGLRTAGSADLQAVTEWIEARHGDPSDRAQQLMACDALFGAPRNGGGVPNNDARRSVVLRGNGTAGAPSGSGSSPGKPDPLKGIPQSYVDSWVRLGLDLKDAKRVQQHADRYWASRHRVGMARPA